VLCVLCVVLLRKCCTWLSSGDAYHTSCKLCAITSFSNAWLYGSVTQFLTSKMVATPFLCHKYVFYVRHVNTRLILNHSNVFSWSVCPEHGLLEWVLCPVASQRQVVISSSSFKTCRCHLLVVNQFTNCHRCMTTLCRVVACIVYDRLRHYLYEIKTLYYYEKLNWSSYY
jgi:hypothetical protein